MRADGSSAGAVQQTEDRRLDGSLGGRAAEALADLADGRLICRRRAAGLARPLSAVTATATAASTVACQVRKPRA